MDERIVTALSQQNPEILSLTKERGWFGLVLDQFHNRLSWVLWVIIVAQLVLFIAGIYCAVQFFAAREVLSALKWGLPAAVMIVLALQLKLSLMPQIQTERLLREIKRTQLILLEKGC
ncbi:MAG: hypothetical protein CSA68_02565 [Rhodobacterales bacterium]|nr:MAG: hypothetical protein CSA68_02565 [Rhodobacterales bacterium]